ncbi:uncharacterized protein EAE98_007051 [Botrytis deweyae]|uniref:Uncharacterized protein n=1 Tax=Botrytis deweyae TaxID=2478750 RepID=A0ABQ7IHY6_9HELO|nr:uncharacterized protein EAE98_007051 [Botrytis deweyae]KAF7924963.1 hypothetical protein EAE98_007051 [Botrytis deweyae]
MALFCQSQYLKPNMALHRMWQGRIKLAHENCEIAAQSPIQLTVLPAMKRPFQMVHTILKNTCEYLQYGANALRRVENFKRYLRVSPIWSECKVDNFTTAVPGFEPLLLA